VSSSDVFVTGLQKLGDDTFLLGIRWPATHIFYGPTTPDTHDPLLCLESMRQAVLVIAHVAFDIPTEFKFITHRKQFNFSPDGLRTAGTRPVDILVVATARDIRRRGRGVAGMLVELTGYRHGVQIGTAAYRWSTVTPAAYTRLRGEHTTATPTPRTGLAIVAPHLVGRQDEIDVMLSTTPHRRTWELHIAPEHPVLFDHRIDHVPGNGAIEAARQAALLILGQPSALPTKGDITFHRYIEFNKSCLVSANRLANTDDHTAAVHIHMEQNGNTSAEGTIELPYH
jgi:hypothetical protein